MPSKVAVPPIQVNADVVDKENAGLMSPTTPVKDDEPLDIDHIFENKALLHCFACFLERHHCAENLHFLFAVLDYEQFCQRVHDGRKTGLKLRNIFEYFLGEEAEEPLNLSAEATAKIKRRGTHDIYIYILFLFIQTAVRRTAQFQPLAFRSLKREVCIMLSTDSVPKFMRSPEYTVWSEENKNEFAEKEGGFLARMRRKFRRSSPAPSPPTTPAQSEKESEPTLDRSNEVERQQVESEENAGNTDDTESEEQPELTE
ncbi:MAG: hypothetical protein MHM6MM_000347 [Cercozoa sp. M6MM]